LHLIRTDLDLHRSLLRFPQKATLLATYSRCVNTGRPLGEVLEAAFPWCLEHRDAIARVFSAYSERKKTRNLLDL
jgi:DNA helicase-2/ATP-dependent DNA helicase PcrA